MHARVISETEKTQGSFCTLMCATRKAILMDARPVLLDNGCAQGMEQIPDVRNLHPGCRAAHNPFNLAPQPCDLHVYIHIYTYKYIHRHINIYLYMYIYIYIYISI